MKKISTLVVGVIVLTSFLFINRVHAQTGPIAKLELWTDSTNTLIDFDSVFFAIPEWPYSVPSSELNGFNFNNVGDEPLVFTISTSNPDFVCEYGTYTLPGVDNEFYMVFRPSRTGLSTGVITITTNDPNHEEITFNVKGYGIESPIDASTEQFDLVIGTSVTKQMVVRNTTPNKARFGIQAEAPNVVVLKEDSIFEWDDSFVLESGDSTTIELFFEYSEIPGPDVEVVPIRVTCEPFPYEGVRTFYIYKIFKVNAIFPAASIGASEDTIHHEVRAATMSSTSFAIENLGDLDFNYSIEMDSLLKEDRGNTGLYHTGFEDFSLGSIDNQHEWIVNSGNSGNFTIASSNPFEGSNHISYYADGSHTRSLLFSPRVALADNDVTVVRMKLDVDLGVTWGITLVSGTEPSTVTTFEVSSNGSLYAYVRDGSNSIPHFIPGALPDSGYFDFRIKVKASTQEFTMYVNNKAIFTGQGRAGVLQSVAFYTYNEESGPRLVIDEFSIYSEPNEKQWLVVEPQSGNISSGASATVNLLFDATNFQSGTYSKILKISTDNILIPTLTIPVTLAVVPNRPPVLSPVANKSVRALELFNLEFIATDPDDSVVSVSIINAPSFVTLTNSGNGSAQYSVKPLIGDGGNYEITVTATDPFGGIATETFNLEVIPYGVQNFSLIYFKTGAVVRNFADTVILDVADPEIEKYTIRANTNPETVGSVNFKLDGATANTDNSKQYTINNWLIPVLSGGSHSITAQAFAKTNGRGGAGQIKLGIIKMINSASITDFDVVNGNGAKLLDLIDGGIIDIGQPGFNMINLVANTSINSVRSIKFILNGSTTRIDNAAPFALKGNTNGSDTFWPTKPGFYTLTAIPYMKGSAWGPEGTPLTIHFQIVNGAGSTLSAGRLANSTNEIEQTIETIDYENVLSVYPVPVVDDLNIELHESIKGNVAVNIMNAQGQSVHLKIGNADEFRKYSISTVQLGISQGIYFVVVNQENGGRIVKKFIKE
ncbi:MAG TPA: T9SS type A sorting domain-containing protein [Chryseolinea sp.]|nr:T9SS type A sorting domain-containing protein [Chryseolinea sp.]